MKKASILQPVNTNLSPAPNSSAAVNKAAKLVPFLKKLQNLSEQCPYDIGHWSCDGKQFDIVDPTRFSEIVLKEHFPNSNTKTFFRQLFYYGFTQLNIMNGGGDERTKGTFSIRHPSFLRDSPSRIFEIKRSAKAGGAGQTQNSRDENEDGEDHRVNVLEQKLSALQSIVDDLSRKLAVLQFQSTTATATPPLPPPPPPLPTMTTAQTNKPLAPPSRKRMHQYEEEAMAEEEEEEPMMRMGSFEEDYSRLATDEIFSLFDTSQPNAAAAEPEELEQDEESFEELLASGLAACPPTPGLSPPPVTTAAPASSTLSTQKLLAALSTVAGCSKQVRDVGDRNKISSSSQDAPMMSV